MTWFTDFYSALATVIKDELQLLFCACYADTVAFADISEITTGAMAGSHPISQPITSHCWLGQTEVIFINALNMFYSSQQG